MDSKQFVFTIALGAAGCSSSGSPVSGAPDGGPVDSASPVDALEEAGRAEAAAPTEASTTTGADAGDAGSATAFSLFVTETPPGSPAMSAWEGVLRFSLAADNAPVVSVAGIEAGAVADPLSLAFRPASSELLVGNRQGNQANQGTISRFLYDPATGSLTANGTITGNGLSGVSQIVFHPVTGEMFVADYNGAAAISRFTFDDAGAVTPSGTLGTGATQGLAFTPDGTLLFATSGGVSGNTIRQYNLADGGVSTAATISSAPRLFFLTLRADELYVGAVDVNAIYRLKLGASNQLTALDSIPADGVLQVVFSPDGLEMFTSGHLTSSLVDTFSYDPAADGWTKTAVVTTSSSLSGILAIPGGAGLSPIDAGSVETPVPADAGGD